MARFPFYPPPHLLFFGLAQVVRWQEPSWACPGKFLLVLWHGTCSVRGGRAAEVFRCGLCSVKYMRFQRFVRALVYQVLV